MLTHKNVERLPCLVLQHAYKTTVLLWNYMDPDMAAFYTLQIEQRFLHSDVVCETFEN